METNTAYQAKLVALSSPAWHRGILLFNGTVYEAIPSWHDQQLIFQLWQTDYAHMLARWLQIGKTAVSDWRYLTCPALLLSTAPDTGQTYFVLGKTTVGNTINFIGGTLDEQHADKVDPLAANLWAECKEEIGLTEAMVDNWRFACLAETEGWFSLVANVQLRLSPTQLQEHFQQFTLTDTEKEISELKFVPATKQGIYELSECGLQIVRPVLEVLLAALGEMSENHYAA